MLSRLAESFFWIGRYVERAEATTRLLLEHHQLMVEDVTVSESAASLILLESLDLGHSDVQRRSDMINVVVGGETDLSTIAGCLSAARENARSVREVLSGEVFEALNAAHLTVARSEIAAVNPGSDLHKILQDLMVIAGKFEWEMPRAESYLFWTIGRALERIDMTARLLNIRYEELWLENGPTTTLRAAAASTPFLRTGYATVPEEVRAYLVLDPEFPRSMLHSARTAEQAVRELERRGVAGSEELLREVGRMHSELEYTDRDANRERVDALIVTSQTSASRASDLAADAFFRQTGTIVWSH